jgi:hypothetical protein
MRLQRDDLVVSRAGWTCRFVTDGGKAAEKAKGAIESIAPANSRLRPAERSLLASPSALS